MPMGELWKPAVPRLHRVVTYPAPGTLAALSTYGYRVSVVTSLGESLLSEETPAITIPTNGAVTLYWSPVPGAVSYNVYGRTVTGPTITTATTTGFLRGGATYGYRLTSLSATGESNAGAESLYAVPVGTNTNKLTLGWNAVSGATGYKVYGRTPGKETLLATWNGSTWSAGSGTATTFVDLGNFEPVVDTPPLFNSGSIRYPNFPLLLKNVTVTSYTDTATDTPTGNPPLVNTSGTGPPAVPQFAVNASGTATGEALTAPTVSDSRWFHNPKNYRRARIFAYTSSFNSTTAFLLTRVWVRSGFLSTNAFSGGTVGHVVKTSNAQLDTPPIGGAAADQSVFDVDLDGDDLLVTAESFNTKQDPLAATAAPVTMTAYRVEFYISFR